MCGLTCIHFSTKVCDLETYCFFVPHVIKQLLANSHAKLSSASHGHIRKVRLLHWAEPCSKVWTEYLMAEDGAGWFMPCDGLQLHVLFDYL